MPALRRGDTALRSTTRITSCQLNTNTYDQSSPQQHIIMISLIIKTKYKLNLTGHLFVLEYIVGIMS